MANWTSRTEGSALPLGRSDALVLLLFGYLAGPIAAAQFANVDFQAVAALVSPTLVPLVGLAAIFSTLGLGHAVGSTAFYVAYVGWAFVLALATVRAGQLLVSHLR
jgi:hypothetical protein